MIFLTYRISGFPNSSVGKESACSAGDLSSIPGSGRSPGKGIGYPLQYSWAFLVAQLVKNLPCNAGDLGSIPRLGKSPGEGKGYPLQYSGWENFMDCIVPGFANSRTRDFTFTTFTCCLYSATRGQTGSRNDFSWFSLPGGE